MAKDVASRVSDDDASAQEARERAAARFVSIHERWSALRADTQAPDPSSPENALANGAAAPCAGSENLEANAEGVRVTPILGIASPDDSEPCARPRFKTLMGVPRSSPDIDVLAGLDVDPLRRRDTVRLERAAHLPPAPPPGPVAEEAQPTTSDEPSLAATSWPWERNATALRQPLRAVPAQWSALVESSLDVSAEVAALRSSSARRYWLAGLGTVAAVVALFAISSPRERTLALRWLSQEYRTRVHPSVEVTGTSATGTSALTDSTLTDSTLTDSTLTDSTLTDSTLTDSALTDRARALRPAPRFESPKGVPDLQDIAHLPSATAAASADPGPAEGSVAAEDSSSAMATSQLALRGVPTLAGTGRSAAAVHAATSQSEAEATSSLEASSSRGATPDEASTARATPVRARLSSESSSRARTTLAGTAAPSLRPVARDPAGNTNKSPQRVAAPRKRSQAPAALATNASKPRATRQNSPRKDTGGGIIRETPF